MDPFITFTANGTEESNMKRRNFLKLTGAAAATLAPVSVSSADTMELRMATSWIKNSPGVGTAAARLAQRIERLSGGRIRIKLFGAGELVGALEVLDAVSVGTADFGHTASFFWQGKMRASVFFTAIPFGLLPQEHMVWIYHDGGQALWDELYEPFSVKPLLASNTSTGMGGWFKKEIKSLDDLVGLKYRMPGLGGEVMRRLGAVPITIPPPDIATSLHSGVVDAAEWLGPWSDLAKGFYKSASYYYGPGFHEPNGTGEFLVNLELWNALPADLQYVIESACIAEHIYSLTEFEWANPEALRKLTEEHGVELRRFPDDILEAAHKASNEILEEMANSDDITSRIARSYLNTKNTQAKWSRISAMPFLQVRNQ